MAGTIVHDYDYDYDYDYVDVNVNVDVDVNEVSGPNALHSSHFP
jgi:hypothetical protein